MPTVDVSIPTERVSLATEWVTLQNHHEAHERNALWMKLAAIFAWSAGVVIGMNAFVLAAVVALIWILEAQLHTFKSRIASRMLRIEAVLRDAAPELHPFQLHSEWLASRPGAAGLLLEYARCGARPTVAFPYVLLLAACLVMHLRA